MNFWSSFTSELEKIALVHSGKPDVPISEEARMKLIETLAAHRPGREARRAAMTASKTVTSKLGRFRKLLSRKPAIAALAGLVGAAGGYGLAKATSKKEKVA
jgi:hypothetical protein